VPEAGVCDEACVLALAVLVAAAVELSTVQVSSGSSLFTTGGSLRLRGFLFLAVGVCGVSGAAGLPLWWTWMCVEWRFRTSPLIWRFPRARPYPLPSTSVANRTSATMATNNALESENEVEKFMSGVDGKGSS